MADSTALPTAIPPPLHQDPTAVFYKLIEVYPELKELIILVIRGNRYLTLMDMNRKEFNENVEKFKSVRDEIVQAVRSDAPPDQDWFYERHSVLRDASYSAKDRKENWDDCMLQIAMDRLLIEKVTEEIDLPCKVKALFMDEIREQKVRIFDHIGSDIRNESRNRSPFFTEWLWMLTLNPFDLESMKSEIDRMI